MATVKNVHSPAGMHYSTSGAQLTTLKDCPGCKYGTLDLVDEGRRWRCADCGRTYPAKAKFPNVELTHSGKKNP